MRLSSPDTELAKLAVAAYGKELQLDCLIEEMAELMADDEIPDDEIHMALNRSHLVLKELVIEARQKGWEL